MQPLVASGGTCGMAQGFRCVTGGPVGPAGRLRLLLEKPARGFHAGLVRDPLALFFEIIGYALLLFCLLLFARIVIETIQSISRDWHPRGATVVILELIFTVTDPPVRLLRRLIPPLSLGAVRFDLSITLLLLVGFFGMRVAFLMAAG